jgi:tetratricopeptide (TPR) repeat protein
VRPSVISFLLAGFLLAGSACACAEVIHLKNGRTIWVDRVRENGSHIEYDIGDDSYAIPKDLVERIETGVAPASSASSSDLKGAHDLPAFMPADNFHNQVLTDKIIQNGKVEEDELSGLEGSGDPTTVAAGYFIAGKHEFDHGNLPKARIYFDTALRFDGQNPSILIYYASLLVRTGNAAGALPYAERAVNNAPDSPDALTVLGYVQYAADRNQDAIHSWKRSLELRPDPTVKKYLETAQRDEAAQTGYSEHESNHFTLHYEGSKTSDGFREQLVATLESEYDDLVRELGVQPRSSISVILYTNQTFFDVTNAPSWTGAVNDGKLRIPVQGLSSVTPELARVLKHELAHSFINQLSSGRCPQWLNEGIAQAVEPKRLVNGARLAELYRTQHAIPLNMLESGFMQLSGPEATLAYDESLAAVLYISDSYGLTDVQRILELLGQGSSAEAALRAVIHSDYGQLESDVGKYLTGKYGN